MKITRVLAVVGLLLLVSSFLPWPGPERAATTAAGPKPAPVADAARGETLFLAKGCATCHRHANVAAPSTQVAIGPDLTHYDVDAAFVRAWLADPAALRPNTLMPDLDLSAGEIEALVAFLEGS